MPGQDDLLRIINAPVEIGELEKVKVKLMEMLELIKSASTLSLFTKNTSGAADFRSQSQLLIDMQAKLKAMETELDALRAKHATSNKARTDQEIADSQRKAQATRGRVAEIRSEEDAYRKLTNEYNKHSQAVKVAAAQYGVHSKEVRAATAALQPFIEKLHAVNKAADDGRSFVGRYTEGIKEGFRDIAKQAAQMVGAFYLIEKALDFIKESVRDFMAAEASTSRLKNILSNMGREDVMGELAKAAKELSEELGTVTEKDVTETFQKLVTYGKLTKNQILELTPVIADFAAKQRIDMPEATGVITKALEGNARGLREYGINIKDGKDATERYKIIMEQLEPKVRGASQAQGDLTVQMKKTEVATEELRVKIGEEFAPAISKIWQSILQGVKGIPEMISSFGDAFANVADNAKYAYFWVKGLFGSVGDLANYEDAKKRNEKILEDSKVLQNARESAEAFRKEAAKKTQTDQAKELVAQNTLLKVDVARYELLKAQGKGRTEEGRAAAEQVVKSVAIVRALTEQLRSTRDTRILGNGDPNAKGGASDEEIKREIEAQAKLYALRLQAAIDYQKVLADEKNNTIASRTEAYKKLIDLERQQVEGERDLKLKNTKLTEGERELIIYEAEEKMMKYRVENIGRLAQIRFDALNNDKILAAENAKELEDIAALHFKAMADLEKKAIADQKAYLQDAANAEHSANDQLFLSGKIDSKTHAKNKSGIDYKASKALLTDASTNADKLLSANPNDPTLQEQSSRARMNLYDLEVQYKDQKDKEHAANKKKLTDLEIQAAKEVGNAVKSFVEGSYERQLNAIQKQIDKNNELKEKETQGIANSTLSLQEKAAAQILLDAKVADSNAALHRKQRDIKVKEAQFDRAASVLEVVEKTAVAIMAAYADLGPIAGTPFAIALGVEGAAQVASILLKPIPQYFTGVESKPNDSLMIVGEKGSERITEPSGKTYMTPGVPTLMYGKKGTRITPAHEVNQEMLSGIMRAQVHQMDNTDIKELNQTMKDMREIGQAQLSAMKKKQVIHNHIHWNPGFNDHINSAVRN